MVTNVQKITSGVLLSSHTARVWRCQTSIAVLTPSKQECGAEFCLTELNS